MRIASILLSVYLILLSCGHESGNNEFNDKQHIDALKSLLHRVIGEKSGSIQIEIIASGSNSEIYEYSCKDGILKVKGMLRFNKP